MELAFSIQSLTVKQQWAWWLWLCLSQSELASVVHIHMLVQCVSRDTASIAPGLITKGSVGNKNKRPRDIVIPWSCGKKKHSTGISLLPQVGETQQQQQRTISRWMHCCVCRHIVMSYDIRTRMINSRQALLFAFVPPSPYPLKHTRFFQFIHSFRDGLDIPGQGPPAAI